MKNVMRASKRLIKNSVQLISIRMKMGLPLNVPDNYIFIVGAQKAGTTALHSYLVQHPTIVEGESKELAFFHKDKVYKKGEKYYRALLPIKMQNRLAIDSTPENLYLERAAQRIHAFQPSAKIIIVLRDPVARAFSAYNMYKQFVKSDLFKNYLDTSNDAPRNFFVPIAKGDMNPTLEYFLDFEMDIITHNKGVEEPALIRRGLYAPQIQRYIELFGRDNVLILFSNNLRMNTFDEVNKTLSFIGREPLQKMNTEEKHVREYNVDKSGKQVIQEYAGLLFEKDKEALKNQFDLNVPW